MSTFPFLSRLNAQDPKTNPMEIQLPKKIKHHFQEPYITERLGYTFFQYIQQLNQDFSRPIVIVSIGTDRSTGDSLGPLVGTKLAAMEHEMHIFGTLDDPVHATNLSAKLDLINEKYFKPLIVAVDASLGGSESVGLITLSQGALKPGTGVNKNLQEVGDMNFTGIVNVGGYMEYLVLQNTRLGIVWKMAESIAQSIFRGYQLAHSYFVNHLVQSTQ
ncbi:spore protease YyaC [Bacillota bacterium LX-D]|nr:spore protease YyaC [Bacillota bacterium LX-D]